MRTSDWKYYYNRNNDGLIRANLVYTPYVNPENNILCMSFNRDVNYHFVQHENDAWDEESLTERFYKEINYREKVKYIIPTLELIEVDTINREIYIEWPGDDFYMMGLEKPYDEILPDWQEQWIHIIETLKRINISKFSLHPNSFVIKNHKLVPFNWFFCYDRDQRGITIASVLKQISTQRLDKLAPVLDQMGMKINKEYTAQQLENVCFNSFRSNYPKGLIERVMNA